MTRRLDIIEAILAERERQDSLKTSGHLKAICADDIPNTVKLAALVEEVGEVARAILGREGWSRDGGDLRQELVQVAAVCLAWLESL